MATADAATDVTVEPEDSASQVAVASQVASSTSRRVALSARRAALEAEAAFAEQQYALELQELQLKQERETLARRYVWHLFRPRKCLLAQRTKQ